MPHSIDRRQFLMLPVLAGVMRASDALRSRLPGREPGQHPDPRPDITAENILTPTQIEANIRTWAKGEKSIAEKVTRINKVFDHAREIPQLLDGLYCYCDCKSAGHRSLLSCFEVAQAVGCWSCKDEAELAYKLHGEGKSLDEIREAIDKKFA
jgi:hypothetical protein